MRLRTAFLLCLLGIVLAQPSFASEDGTVNDRPPANRQHLGQYDNQHERHENTRRRLHHNPQNRQHDGYTRLDEVPTLDWGLVQKRARNTSQAQRVVDSIRQLLKKGATFNEALKKLGSRHYSYEQLIKLLTGTNSREARIITRSIEWHDTSLDPDGLRHVLQSHRRRDVLHALERTRLQYDRLDRYIATLPEAADKNKENHGVSTDTSTSDPAPNTPHRTKPGRRIPEGHVDSTDDSCGRLTGDATGLFSYLVDLFRSCP